VGTHHQPDLRRVLPELSRRPCQTPASMDLTGSYGRARTRGRHAWRAILNATLECNPCVIVTNMNRFGFFAIVFALLTPTLSLAADQTSPMARLQALTAQSQPKQMSSRSTKVASENCPTDRCMPNGCRCDNDATCNAGCCGDGDHVCDGNGNCECRGD
jgi:hypothetical protein